MKSYSTPLLISLTLLLIVSGCGGNDTGEPDYTAVETLKSGAPEIAAGSPGEGENPLAQPKSSKRMLIRNGNLEFSSPDVEKSVLEIKAFIDEFNGYVGSEEYAEDGYRKSVRLTVRIPSGDFDNLTDKIGGLDGKVKYFRTEVEDVTEEYVDLEARAHQLGKLEERYLELLKNAREMKDILAIESELNATRTEIEQLQGRIRLLGDRVRYSTLRIHCYQELDPERDSFGNRFISSLTAGWGIFLSFVLALAAIWPFLLVLLAVLLVFYVRRRRNRI